MTRRPIVPPCCGLLLCGACAIAPADGAPLGPVTGIAVGDTIASCSQRGIAIGLGQDMRTLRSPARVFDLAFAQGGRELLCGGGTPGVDGCVWLQRPDAPGALRRIADDVVTAVAAAATADLGAAGCADGRVVTFALHGDTAPTELQRHTAACRTVAFAPDGRLLASGGRDGLLLLHDLARGSTSVCTGATAAIECVRFGADGQTVAAGCADGRVRLFARDGRLLRTWQRLGGSVLGIVETPTGWCAGVDDGRLLCLRDDGEGADLLQQFAAPIHALAWKGDQLLLGLHGALVAVPLRGATP